MSCLSWAVTSCVGQCVAFARPCSGWAGYNKQRAVLCQLLLAAGQPKEANAVDGEARSARRANECINHDARRTLVLARTASNVCPHPRQRMARYTTPCHYTHRS